MRVEVDLAIEVSATTVEMDEQLKSRFERVLQNYADVIASSLTNKMTPAPWPLFNRLATRGHRPKGSIRRRSVACALRFWRGARRDVCLGHPDKAVRIPVLWRCYRQTFGPHRHLAKFVRDAALLREKAAREQFEASFRAHRGQCHPSCRHAGERAGGTNKLDVRGH